MQNQQPKKTTKYAEPDSLAFRAHYVQKRRKRRKQPEIITRFFTEFDEVAQSYISFPSISLNSDFEIKTKVALTSSFVTNYVFGNSGGFRNRLAIFFDGNVSLRSDEGEIPLEVNGAFNDTRGDIVEILLERVGDAISLYLNGVLLDSVTVASTTSFVIDQLCRNEGAVEPVKTFELFEVKDNGTTILDMPIDQNYTPTNNTVIDLASGNNGTFVNVADGDSVFYQLIGNNWVDSEGNALEIAQ